MSGVHAWLERIAAVIGPARVDLANEKKTQADIERVLSQSGLPFWREARIGPGDIPDFLVDDRFAVEVKLRGRKIQIYQQLCRYAAYPQIDGLVFVSNISMGLPDEIQGKPTRTVSLGAAWL